MDAVAGSSKRVTFRSSRGSGIPTSSRQQATSCDKFRGSLIPRLRSSSVDRYQPPSAHKQFSRFRSSSADREQPPLALKHLVSGTPRNRSRKTGSNIIFGKARSSVLDKKRTQKDPRPLHDKSYQNQYAQRLAAFLQQKGYPHSIGTKTLTCPSKMEFLQVFQFLYSFWDPQYVPSQKCEEEIPKIMKMIRYPFAINKSTLLTVGTNHSWPTLLGILIWLMDMAQYMDNLTLSDFFKSGSEFDSNQNKQMFFELVCKMYSDFLATGFEDDNKKEDLLRNLAEQCYGKVGNIDDLVKEETNLLEQLEDSSEKLSKMFEVKERNRILKEDIGKCSDYIQKMTVCITPKEVELKETRLQKEEQKADQGMLKARIRELEKQRQSQMINASEFHRHITFQKKTLRDDIDRSFRRIEDMKKESWDLEIKMTKNADIIEQVSQEFNKEYSQMKNLFPKLYDTLSTLNSVEGKKLVQNFEVTLPEFHLPRRFDPVVFTQLTENIEPAIQKEKLAVKGLLPEMEKLVTVYEQKAHEMFLSKKDIEHMNEMLDIKIKQKEAEMQTRREEMETEINALQSQVKSLAEDLDNRRKSEKQMVEDAERELQELEAEVEKKTQENKEYFKEGEKVLDDCMALARERMVELEEMKRNFMSNLHKAVEEITS